MEIDSGLHLNTKTNPKKAMNPIVRIPEPCHEDWNQMKPDEKGRFCKVCSKSVHDFSNKTDDYIHSVLKESKENNVQVCGHFRKSQIDRPLQLKIPFIQVSSHVSRLNAFAVALFFVFGTFLFSCSDNAGRTVGEISLEVPDKKEQMMMDQWASLGKPVMPQDTPVVENCTEMLGEVIMTETRVNGGISYDPEPMVDGGAVIIEEPLQPLPPDTMIEKRPEEMIAGGISYHYIEKPEIVPVNVVADSLEINKPIAPVTQKENKLQVYPNPSTGEFSIAYEVKQKGTVLAEIYDMNGNLVRTIVKSQTQHTGRYVVPVNLSELANGIYICKVIINGKEQHEEVVITN